MRCEHIGLLLIFGSVAAACGIKTNQVSIGQKTSLERQLMGDVEPLSEEELLVASVRGPGSAVPGSPDELQSQAIAARRRQLFNRDELDELKRAGCLGEAQHAVLVSRPCDREPAPELAARRSTLLDQENADRRVIIDWALAIDAVLTAADRPQVVEVYHRLWRERLHAGAWIQGDDGGWTRR